MLPDEAPSSSIIRGAHDSIGKFAFREEDGLGSPLYSGLPNVLPPDLHFSTSIFF